MPGFDGTGPQGNGPFTGGGRGYCAIAYPQSGRPYGYAGLQGRPVRGTDAVRGNRTVREHRLAVDRRRTAGVRPRGRGRGHRHGRRGR